MGCQNVASRVACRRNIAYPQEGTRCACRRCLAKTSRTTRSCPAAHKFSPRDCASIGDLARWCGHRGDARQGEKRDRAMKTAHQLVDEIALEVRPPKGVAIELHERSGSPNWVDGAPPMTVALADKFSAKIAALRKSDPIIDWSAAPSGRVAKFLSEV